MQYQENVNDTLSCMLTKNCIFHIGITISLKRSFLKYLFESFNNNDKQINSIWYWFGK